MESVASSQPKTDRESIVICVHGTFAGSEEDTGTRWWQSGSPFSKRLASHLPGSVRLANRREIFHWSGENSERARSRAAVDLFRTMKSMEESGKEFHLVGHSHGGSVIWHALKQATLQRQCLDGLRSWTTVGTPFLQHRSRSAWNPLNLLGILLALVLVMPFSRSVADLHGFIHNAIHGGKPRLVTANDADLGYSAILRAPFLAMVESLGVPVKRREDGIHLGSFDPEGDQAFANYLVTSWEGVVLMAAIALHGFAGLLLMVWSVSPVIESYRIRCEQRLEKKSYHRFGARWLGIWSRDDEAINGLRATLDLEMSVVSKMMPHERVFVSDTPALISRPIFWLIAPVYNRIIQPVLDRTVRNMIVRSAQGNDRPTATLIEVTPTPLREVNHRFAELPPKLNKKLLSYSDMHARSLVPLLRNWLGRPSLEAGMQSLSGKLTGHELIHTSYFEHDEIAALISCNIALGTPTIDLPFGNIRLTEDLLDWFEMTKRELSKACGPDPIRFIDRSTSKAA